MADILVIDSDTAVRERLYDALVTLGHNVLTAGSGPQAFESLKTRRPQLIFVRAALAGKSGLDTAQEIRGFDDAVPIIFLTTAADSLPAERLTHLGVTETLSTDGDAAALAKQLADAVARLRTSKNSGPNVKVRGTLLVVDDDPQIQRLLKGFFESHGLKVVLAGSGEEALKALGQKPLAVMLDVNMPGMDGLLALKKLKAEQPKLPVIMATGVGEEATVREALNAGAYDYVSKPFNLEYLETVVLTKVLLGIEG